MSCEACGGDGQIEYGAYRGDDSTETRECRLCGGAQKATLGNTETVGAALTRLGQAATKAGVTLKESTSGSRRTVAVIETQHEHSWKERLFADLVEYACDCPRVAIFSRRDGSLINPADISEFDKLYLSSRTMVRFPLYAKTAKDYADERLEQLRQENDQRQREAESHRHQWSAPQPFGPYVRFCCIGCSKALVFSKHGNLSDGEAPDPFIVDELSRKAIVFAARREDELLRTRLKS